VALLAHLAVFGTEVIRCGVVLPEAFFFAFTAGSRLELRDARIGLAVTLGLIATEGAYFLGAFAVVPAAVAGITWGVGRVVRSRGAMVEDLEARTTELRVARDERARLEVASDRARLSGELDELLQRRLGELARLADARPGDPAAATATLAEIEHQSRGTLEEMRAVVGVLREDDDVPTSPQPTLLNLEALLVRAKGADARLTVEGSPRVLPAGVELSAYRIAEHLLGALEDAPDVDVRVRFADDAIELAVSGPARRGAKAAFEQARERARLQHGTLQASTRGGHAEAVASLPVMAAV
jgi:signal transduction histidine kinase